MLRILAMFLTLILTSPALAVDRRSEGESITIQIDAPAKDSRETSSTDSSTTSAEKILGLKKRTYRMPSAEIDKALELDDQGKRDIAMAIFKEHADKGDPQAMVTVGQSYYAGEGVEKDFNKAAEWFAKAALYTDGDALSNLSRMFREGEGVTKNIEIAYDLGIIVHVLMLGNDETQIRAGGNIDKAYAKMTKAQQEEALKFTSVYVMGYAISLGNPSDRLKMLKNDPQYVTIGTMLKKL